jgi:hypothetical protein
MLRRNMPDHRTSPSDDVEPEAVDAAPDLPVAVIESYGGWLAPFDAATVVRRLLRSVPHRHLAGLRSVVLSSTAALNRARRRQTTRSRGKKVRAATCRGLYHPAWRGEPAWIELFVDTVVGSTPRPLLRLPPWRDLEIASVLFHELGHHIHDTHDPAHREPEVVAEEWRRCLSRAYFRRRYWYLVPLVVALRPFGAMALRRAERRLEATGR